MAGGPSARRLRAPRFVPAWLAICAAAGGCATTQQPMPMTQAASDLPITLDTPTGRIHGSLDLPAAAGPVPVVLLIAGSGPTDRNGNIGGAPGANNGHHMLARALAERGIASVRYDKRGIAGSGAAATREEDLRFESYVDDASGWIRKLREDPRFSTITVAGHSEGSLIGMLAARQAEADAFVSIAGIARRASDVLRTQLGANLPAPLLERSEQALVALERGESVADVPPELMVLFRPSVQPYLISWFRYLPTEEIARLRIPTLIVQGTTDVQVAVSEAEALARALPAARLEIIEGMNHVLKPVSGGLAEQQPSYFDPTLPLAPGLVETVAGFVATMGR